MQIRNSVKAVVIQDGRILLKRSELFGRRHYELPGGGQQWDEKMDEALLRECLEETGYRVKMGAFIALFEEISDNPMLRERYPEYAHKVFHVFEGVLADAARAEPTEQDLSQVGIEWVELDRLPSLALEPVKLRDAILAWLQTGAPRYLGSERVD